jgi:6-phosphogluconate dehydrogenase
MEPKADIALIGLAVMGQNLILNMNDHGFTVVAHNRTVEKVDHFLANEAKGTQVVGARSIPEMVAQLKKPRRVMMLVKAGAAVDEFIEHLLPHLEPGDIIIDGGNSLFQDTIRRMKYGSRPALHRHRVSSGGRARRGEHHAGGSPAWDAWPIFQAIAAKVDDGVLVATGWANGAGHCEMTHNGIEYGDMQLICEAYTLMKDGLGYPRRDARSLRIGKRRTRQYPSRSPRHPRVKTSTARRWSTKSSTPQGRRAPASGR